MLCRSIYFHRRKNGRLTTSYIEHNIGYSLWNLRGTFGIVDSDRVDVAYEEWQGHKLDRKLLDLLQEF